MTTDVESKPVPMALTRPAAENAAVARCCAAAFEAFRAARAKHKGETYAQMDADKAYCTTLPPLSGAENIRDFIACVAHGMSVRAISGPDGARLLYAAQVAYTATRVPLEKSDKPRRTQPVLSAAEHAEPNA